MSERIATHELRTYVARARDGPPTATLCRLPIVLIMAGHGRWRRRPGITGYVGTPPCPASSHDRDAGAAKGDDLLIPAHRPREA